MNVDELLAARDLKPVEAKNHGLKTRVLMIGPKEAEALLVANRDNRNLRPGRVRFYAATMLEGGWR
jgi:hypothetical protein